MGSHPATPTIFPNKIKASEAQKTWRCWIIRRLGSQWVQTHQEANHGVHLLEGNGQEGKFGRRKSASVVGRARRPAPSGSGMGRPVCPRRSGGLLGLGGALKTRRDKAAQARAGAEWLRELGRVRFRSSEGEASFPPAHHNGPPRSRIGSGGGAALETFAVFVRYHIECPAAPRVLLCG